MKGSSSCRSVIMNTGETIIFLGNLTDYITHISLCDNGVQIKGQKFLTWKSLWNLVFTNEFYNFTKSCVLDRSVCTAAVSLVTSFAVVGFPIDGMERGGIRSFLRLSSLVRKVLMHVFLNGYAFIQYQQFCYSLLISSVALSIFINMYTEYTAS